MDPLTQALMQRQLTQPQPPEAPQPIPSSQAPLPAVPPNPSTKVPQATKRFENTQKIMDAYRGGWATNPVLLRVQLGHK